MSTTTVRLNKYTTQRRSQRVMLAVKILVAGDLLNGQRFSEETFTSVVNAHGALILLAQQVTAGQLLTIRNLKSGAELQGEVVDVGLAQGGKSEVGIEFRQPSPRFWRVAFPPEDWSPHSPEAKRRTTAPTPVPRPASPK